MPTSTLTKAEIAEELSEQLGFNSRESKELVDLFFEETTAALEEGDEVRISGLGRFTLRDKEARPGRNPKTGEETEVSERTVVLFHAGSTLTENLKQIEVEEETL